MRFKVEIAKRGQAACKFGKCKQKIEKGLLRIGKISPSPFAEGSEMTQWFHAKCLFQQMQNPRAAKLESVDELDGFDELEDSDKELIQDLIQKLGEPVAASSGTPQSAKKSAPKKKKGQDEEDGDEDESPAKKKKKTATKKTASKKKKTNKADDNDADD